MKTNEIRKELESKKCRSAWDKGVNEYALELCEELENAMNYEELEEVPTSSKLLEKMLLNGADSWEQYSWGGCSLIYNGDIAERLCSPSEFKKCREGERRPNAREEWLDTQARALYQACNRIKRIVANYN
jgi:hypothetical protein